MIAVFPYSVAHSLRDGLRATLLMGFAVWLGVGTLVQAADNKPSAPELLETFFRVPTDGARVRWVRAGELPGGGVATNFNSASTPTNGARAMFRAVRPQAWYRGLVPIYVVDLEKRIELRRLPGRGQENFSEPLFFGLPPVDEPPETLRIGGRWEVRALRGDRSPALFAWELAADGSRVAGRFEQLTDYRFAYLTSGTFRSNRLELTVEYVADRFAVRGTWSAGKLQGDWHRLDQAEAGTWEAQATLVEPQPLSTGDCVALYEWRRSGSDDRCYEIEGVSPGEGWERAARPLARVWSLRARP